MNYRRRASRIYAVLFILIFTACVRADTSGQITDGPARFTVLTPQCIRLEYNPAGKFVDEPSYFAVNRDLRQTNAKISNGNSIVTIDTGIVKLTYKPDGKPFDAENLHATIQKDNATVDWHPGLANIGNLGGTERTLDGWDGARKLSDGILSRDGWYLLDDSKSPLFTSDWVKARPDDAGRDWYLFAYGSDYKSALKSLMAVSGPVPMPRRYTLGVWYSRYWPYTSDEFRQIVKEYADHDFPLDTLVLDMDWHLDGWTGYTWNPKLLADHQQLLDWVHSHGLALTLNDHPAQGVQPHEECYTDFMKAMGQDPAGKTTIPFDAGDKKYLDTFYAYTHKPLEKQGVDFWWLDWQQFPSTRSIPTLSNLQWLNHYYYQQTGTDGKRGQSFSRWGGWGSQRYPIQFSGDASTAFRMLAAEVPFTSTAGNVGCFFWSHDIGGHNRGRNEESYARWCQFGAFSTTLRSHSTRDKTLDRRPWTYPDWALDSMKVSFQLRSKFFPYLYTAMKQACDDSLPFIRPMYLDNPTIEAAYHQPQEYQFGDNLLVAPIAEKGAGPNRLGRQTVWFPPGTWYNYFTNEKFEGNQQILTADPIGQFPLYVRGGVPIPMQPFTQRMATDPIKQLRIRCYPGVDGQQASSVLYEDDGTTDAYKKGAFATTKLTYARNGNQITISIDPTQGKFDGQLEQRSYLIELCAVGDPTDTTGEAIGVPAHSIREPYQFVGTFVDLDQNAVRSSALAKRLGFPEDADATPTNLVAKALNLAKAEDEKTAICAAAGVGVFGRNENVYGYPAAATDQVFDSSLMPAKIDRIQAADDGVASTTGASYRVSIAGRDFVEPGTSTPIDFAAIKDNIAPQATVTLSSGGPARGIIDGHVGGYPDDRNNEWTSDGEKSGAWAKLQWPTPQKINRVILFDRPNLADHVLAGTIEFSDGSTEPFGELPNDAVHGTEVKFDTKTVDWLKITITKTSPLTENIGLSEVVVMKAGDH